MAVKKTALERLNQFPLTAGYTLWCCHDFPVKAVHSDIRPAYGKCTVHSGSRRRIKPPYVGEEPLAGAGVNVFLFSGPWEDSLQTSQCLTQRCLVRPNMPQADHCLPAYKLKYIASAVRYYLFLLPSAVSNFPLRGAAYFSEANVRSSDLISMRRAEDE